MPVHLLRKLVPRPIYSSRKGLDLGSKMGQRLFALNPTSQLEKLKLQANSSGTRYPPYLAGIGIDGRSDLEQLQNLAGRSRLGPVDPSNHMTDQTDVTAVNKLERVPRNTSHSVGIINIGPCQYATPKVLSSRNEAPGYSANERRASRFTRAISPHPRSKRIRKNPSKRLTIYGNAGKPTVLKVDSKQRTVNSSLVQKIRAGPYTNGPQVLEIALSKGGQSAPKSELFFNKSRP